MPLGQTGASGSWRSAGRECFELTGLVEKKRGAARFKWNKILGSAAEEEMLLDRLLVELTLHYRDRGYPESALMHLRWVLITNTQNDHINLKTAYQHC
ncbi:MAG TPA: hypothetical protein VGZ47_03655, partial [Gemmataceae bacterium]|nr:hypothetical protein [Gemmataceae bacterium]